MAKREQIQTVRDELARRIDQMRRELAKLDRLLDPDEALLEEARRLSADAASSPFPDPRSPLPSAEQFEDDDPDEAADLTLVGADGEPLAPPPEPVQHVVDPAQAEQIRAARRAQAQPNTRQVQVVRLDGQIGTEMAFGQNRGLTRKAKG